MTEFVSAGTLNSSLTEPKKGALFDLRTGKPFQVPEADQFGRCRYVTDFEKLNRCQLNIYINYYFFACVAALSHFFRIRISWSSSEGVKELFFIERKRLFLSMIQFQTVTKKLCLK